MLNNWFRWLQKKDRPRLGALEILKYIGPGLLVTVGFIDPGNWASNLAAGSSYGYRLLWMVTLSTVMLIVLQHNAAHLGIRTGLCLSESATINLKPFSSRFVLFTAFLAAAATALAEILGGAIGLRMLFGFPLWLGTSLSVLFVCWMLFANAYRRLEKWIIAFVSLIGLSFLFELLLVKVDWLPAVSGWFIPSFPEGSMVIVMSVLGAVVMPHNLFLHSEIIQSRQWNREDEAVIERQLKYEFLDTLLAMLVGWAINSAMILVAAATFHAAGIKVGELEQAQYMLRPLLGQASAVVFAVALLLSGLSSSVTAAMAGGSIFSGLFKEPYDIADRHTKTGVVLTLVLASASILLIRDVYQGLILSQVLLSIQLPLTVFLQIFLTSSPKVMGRHANTLFEKAALWAVAALVSAFNVMLLLSFLR